jgi:hypothetical protein
MEFYCYYLLSVLLYMCLSPYVVHKGKKETSVGGAYRDNKTKSNRENHEIQKATEQELCSPKLTRTGSGAGRPIKPMGWPA